MSLIKLYRSSYLILIFAWIALQSNLFALYPSKIDYDYDKDNFGIYVNASLGASGSDTFGALSKEHYSALYNPVRMLSSGLISGALGMRLFDLRVETELLHFYHFYNIIYDRELVAGDFSTENFPEYGTEYVDGLAINVYYDMRFFSDTIYPYIGLGIGNSNYQVSFVDLEKQPNGLGEQYRFRGNKIFRQFMIGIQYDLKIIRSSVGFEYRLMSVSNTEMVPENDGLHDIIDDGYKPGGPDSSFPADWTPPEKQNVSPIFHSIIFTFKYYLY